MRCPVRASDLCAYDRSSLRILLDVPADLSGYTFYAQARALQSIDSSLVATFTIDPTNAADGEVWFTLDKPAVLAAVAACTQADREGRPVCWYDICAYVTGVPDDVATFAKGEITWDPNVSLQPGETP